MLGAGKPIAWNLGYIRLGYIRLGYIRLGPGVIGAKV
jgi:hypothetical protein